MGTKINDKPFKFENKIQILKDAIKIFNKLI